MSLENKNKGENYKMKNTSKSEKNSIDHTISYNDELFNINKHVVDEEYTTSKRRELFTTIEKLLNSKSRWRDD